jgi:proteasome lid subunit RPN8/RPN11
MHPATLILSPGHAAALRTAAEAAFPEECCGLMVGRGGDDGVVVTDLVPTRNVAEDRTRHFEIDPQTQFDLLRRLRGQDLRVIGHYHSHPNGAAALSAHDRSMAHDPTAIWIVVPVENGRSGPPVAFVCLAPTRVEAVTIQSSPEAPGRNNITRTPAL